MKHAVMSLITTIGVASLLCCVPTYAVKLIDCDGMTKQQCDAVSEKKLANDSDTIWNVMSTIFGLLAAISVIMIIIGGIKYATSQGDSSAVASAKNTILYAVIGLIVALLATAIVLFIKEWIAS